MKFEVYFSEIVKITPDGGEISIIDFKPSPIPGQKGEATKLADILKARDDYATEAAATGLCGRIYTRQIGRDRAVNGFKKINHVLINRQVGLDAPDV